VALHAKLVISDDMLLPATSLG